MKKMILLSLAIAFVSVTANGQQPMTNDEKNDQITELKGIVKSQEEKIVILRNGIKYTDSVLAYSEQYIKSIEEQLSRNKITSDKITKRKVQTPEDKKKLKELANEEKRSNATIEKTKLQIADLRKRNEETLRSVNEISELIKTIRSKIKTLEDVKL